MKNITLSNKTDTLIKVILFLISPFVSFLYSLRNIKSKSSYIVFFLFCVFFGMALTIPENYSGDASVYQKRFEYITNYDNTKFLSMLQNYSEFDDGEKDIYFKTTAFIVSRISGNYHTLFCVFAAIFAFFMLKSLRFLTREQEFDNSFIPFLLVTIFILSNFIFNINGVRFWTASWIGIYSVFQIFINNNKKYFLLACVTPLVHVSFFAFVIILIVGYFTKQYEKFWIFMLFISFILSNIMVNLVSSFGDYLPSFMSNTVSIYTDVDYVKQREEDLVLYARIFSFLRQLMINIVVLLFIRNRKTISSPTTKNLYFFLIIFTTFVNFVMPIPSFGGRFLALSLPLIAYIWVIAFKNTMQYRPILYLFIVAFSYHFFLQIRGFFKLTEIDFYIFNPFYIINKYLLI